MAQHESTFSPSIARLTTEWKFDRFRNWPKFLESIWMGRYASTVGLRGWDDTPVRFDYPVVAVAGENGSGKSTVLKAVAAGFSQESSASGPPTPKSFSPDDFFPTTPWENVEGVQFEYQYRQGATTTTHALRKPTRRWRGMPDRPSRPVFFLDISRTQPIDTVIGYGRLARTQLAESKNQILLTEKSRAILSRVLGRTYESGSIFTSEGGKQVGVVESGGTIYSNYHQGAGEDATADLVALLQEVPRYSLVVIDEVEASLHPRAQRRLMTELIEIVREKRLQLVLSTHSPYVLEQIPPEARIYLQWSKHGGREVIYGVSPEYALTLMDDHNHPDLFIYCEDKEGASIVETLLRANKPQLIKRVKIVPVGPASTVATLGRLSVGGALPHPALGVLDADQGKLVGCIRLPGSRAPEVDVYKSMTPESWGIVAERLGVRTGDLLDAAEDAFALEDHHAWSRRIATALSEGMAASRIWDAAADVWVRELADTEEVESFVERVESAVAGNAVEPEELSEN
jgi:predicted ATPase